MEVRIISGIVAAVAAMVIVIVSNNRSVKKKTPGEVSQSGDIVLRGRSSNKMVTYLCFVVGVVVIGISVATAFTELTTALGLLMLGGVFIFLGYYYIAMTRDNRIEYNDREIRQYIILRKNPRVLKWEEITKASFQDMGPFLILANKDGVQVIISFSFDGILPLLQYLPQKLTGESQKLAQEIYSRLK